MTWRPKCRRCWETIEPGSPRRRVYETDLARRAGFWFVPWGSYLCADCYADMERLAAGEEVEE